MKSTRAAFPWLCDANSLGMTLLGIISVSQRPASRNAEEANSEQKSCSLPYSLAKLKALATMSDRNSS